MKKILYADPNPQWTRKEKLYEYLPESYELEYTEASNRDAFVRGIKQADYLITGWQAGTIDKALLCTAEKLRFIQVMGAGYENIDIDAAKRLHIPVSNTAGINAVSVSEHVLMFLLQFYKRFSEANAALHHGLWPYPELQSKGIEELKDKTIGIIGYGHIGREIAKRLYAFDTVILYDDLQRNREDEEKYHMRFVPIDDMLPVCDAVILQVPLTNETRNLIDASRLSCMKEGALLINTARGGIVDERALCDAIKSGHLAGACIDCFENEPLKENDPLIGNDRIFMTPHIAGATNHIFEKSIMLAYDNILRVEQGLTPMKLINP